MTGRHSWRPVRAAHLRSRGVAGGSGPGARRRRSTASTRTGRDGIYRTVDGGATWTLVFKSTWRRHRRRATSSSRPMIRGSSTPCRNRRPAPLARASGFVAISHDAGATWTTQSLRSARRCWHIAVGPLEPDGTRRVYAVGDSVVLVLDGRRPDVDDGPGCRSTDQRNVRKCSRRSRPAAAKRGRGRLRRRDCVRRAATRRRSSRCEPGNPEKVYLATTGGALGPDADYVPTRCPTERLSTPRCGRLAGEASLWLGDFSRFELNNGSAQWGLLPGPPVYTGRDHARAATATSRPKRRAVDSSVFFSDNSHVHVSVGTPTRQPRWHRLDGMDASVAQRTSGVNFERPLHARGPACDRVHTRLRDHAENPPAIPAAYNKNSELDQHVAGRSVAGERRRRLLVR